MNRFAAATKVELQNWVQQFKDVIATKREMYPHQAIPQPWLDGLAECHARLAGMEPPPPDSYGTKEVFGHPRATNIKPHVYGTLIPLIVKPGDNLGWRIKLAETFRQGLATKMAEADAIKTGRIKKGERFKTKKAALEYLKSYNSSEDEAIHDLLRMETLPELYRLDKLIHPQATTAS